MFTFEVIVSHREDQGARTQLQQQGVTFHSYSLKGDFEPSEPGGSCREHIAAKQNRTTIWLRERKW